MEKFSLSGLWEHIGSTVIAAGLLVGDATLSYLGVVALPNWLHGVVAVAAMVLGLYNGRKALLPPAKP